jgi:hypothetical protein
MEVRARRRELIVFADQSPAKMGDHDQHGAPFVTGDATTSAARPLNRLGRLVRVSAIDSLRVVSRDREVVGAVT